MIRLSHVLHGVNCHPGDGSPLRCVPQDVHRIRRYIGYGCLVTCVALIVMKTYLHVDGSCNDVGTASKMS